MKKLILEIHDDILKVLEKLENSQDTEVELEIPEGSVLFDNIVNLKILQKEADNLGKSLNFKTLDENGAALIDSILSGTRPQDEFVSREFTPSRHMVTPKESLFSKLGGLVPSMPRISLFTGGRGFSKVLIILVVLGLLGGLGYLLITQVPQAFVKISVDSQPLIKSISIKVVLDKATSAKERVLNGRKVEAVASDTASIEPTGVKIVGETASGKIKIYNYTDQEVEFGKGTEVYFNEDDYDLTYKTKSTVTIPAETLKEPGVPGSPTVPGEATVDVEATEIGEDSNIDKGNTLTFDDYKKSEIVAAADADFSGGESSEVKVVAEADLLKLEEELQKKLTENSENVLKAKQGVKYKLIDGSTSTSIVSKKYSAELDDETDSLSLDMEVKAFGLSYSTDELNRLLDALVDSFIPDGFKLSAKNKSISVEILGNSDDTVLSASEADLQVTLKAYVVPGINESDLKTDLKGKKLNDARDLLNNIQNINSFELSISPNIPFFGRMPVSEENINLEIILN